MKILFLHGWKSKPVGVKPNFLAQHGHKIISPTLSDDAFEKAVRIAQTEVNRHDPDVIVGSSRGGAVAMNIDAKGIPLVLLCPAWKKWGTATTVKKETIILHSMYDEVVPLADSEELLTNSELPESALVILSDDHRLDNPESLNAMVEACWDDRYHAIHEASHAVVGKKMGLSPKIVSVGRTDLGTSGGIGFCSNAALERDLWRRLMILVAGYVGTQMFGYGNLLASEKLLELLEDEEPGYMSDEWFIWVEEHQIQEIQDAESKARLMLENNRDTVLSLANELLTNRELERNEIRSFFQRKGLKLSRLRK